MLLQTLHHLAGGPFFWIAIASFVLGIAWRIRDLFMLTEKQEKIAWPNRGVRADSPEERKSGLILALQQSMPGRYPVMTMATAIFHGSLIITPLFALGHSLFLKQSIGVTLFSLPAGLIDLLTLVAVAGTLFMLLRRLFLPRVRAVSAPEDFLFLVLTAMPYISGFCAYHLIFDYKTIITIHMVAGEALLISLPFTKLTHMVFIFFARVFIKSEHLPNRAERVWKP